MQGYWARELAHTIAEALNDLPVAVVTGMRQVGKSTMLENDSLFSDRAYLGLDDFGTLAELRENPYGVLDRNARVSIDEAQRYPEIFMALKRVVDKERQPGRFLLSGSANFALLRGVSESLAGRAIYFDLLPMSRREISGEIQNEPFIVSFFRKPILAKDSDYEPVADREVLQGGLPPVAVGGVRNRASWFKGYEQTYLERDLRDVASVENVFGFRNLLKLTALRTAQILNASELARDASLPTNTATRYLGWMEASFMIRRLPPFMRNKSSSVIKTPKVFLTDSGLACYLCGCRDLRDDPLRGAFLETYVFQNLLSILEAHFQHADLFYWRTRGGSEVDFVIDEARQCVAIEVKSGARWDRRDLKGLRSFLEATPRCKAAILAYNGTEVAQLGDRLWVIPLGLLLS